MASNFTELAASKQLTDCTVSKLQEEGFESEELVSLMQDDDIKSLNLNRGQQRALERWVSQLKQEPVSNDQQASGQAIQRKTMKIDVKDSFKNLGLAEKKLKDAAEYMDKNKLELDKIQDYFKLNEHMNEKVNIAVIGRTGVGKSSWINSVRGLTGDDEEAAKVDYNERTTERHPYAHPDMPNLLFWDIPGFGTEQFSKKEYLDKFPLKDFDILLIFTSDRFTADDLWLANEAHKVQKRFYMIRNKIDQDITNERRDHPQSYDTSMILEKAREKIIQELKNKNLPYDRVYIVSSLSTYQNLYNFPKLVYYMGLDSPRVLPMALMALSREGIKKKSETLIKRIQPILEKAVTMSYLNEKLIEHEIALYTTQFGLTEEQLAQKGLDSDARKEITKAYKAGMEKVTSSRGFILKSAGASATAASAAGLAILGPLGAAGGAVAGGAAGAATAWWTDAKFKNSEIVKVKEVIEEKMRAVIQVHVDLLLQVLEKMSHHEK